MRTQRNLKSAIARIQSTAAEGSGSWGGHLSFVIAPALLAASTIALTSCSAVRPLKGGKALTARGPSGRIEQTLAQGDNASQPTRQDQETIKARCFTLPAGSRIEQSSEANLRGAAGPILRQAGSPALSMVLSAPMPVIEREEVRARTELGAAQKDAAGELGARLASFRGITWAGAALFIFGLASLVWAPLKAVIGSVTTSAAIALGGLALMILPTLIVGNELIILGGVVLGTGAWFLAHRHGQLRGQLSASAPGSAGVSPASPLSQAPQPSAKD